MVDRNWGDRKISAIKTANSEGHTGGDFNETNRWIDVVGNTTEIGPRIVIEEVSFDIGKDSFCRIDGDRLVGRTKDILNQERQRGCVIAVVVRNDDVLDSSLLIDLEGTGDCPGIDRDDVIDQKGCHPTGRTISPKTTEHPKFHQSSITCGRQGCIF